MVVEREPVGEQRRRDDRAAARDLAAQQRDARDLRRDADATERDLDARRRDFSAQVREQASRDRLRAIELRGLARDRVRQARELNPDIQSRLEQALIDREVVETQLEMRPAPTEQKPLTIVGPAEPSWTRRAIVSNTPRADGRPDRSVQVDGAGVVDAVAAAVW